MQKKISRRKFLKFLGLTVSYGVIPGALTHSPIEAVSKTKSYSVDENGFINVARQIVAKLTNNNADRRVMIVPYREKVLIYNMPVWETIEATLQDAYDQQTKSIQKVIRYLITGAIEDEITEGAIHIHGHIMQEVHLDKIVSVSWENNHGEITNMVRA